MILADLKNTPLLQSCHMALLEERKAVVWDLIWEVRCLNHFGDSSHYPILDVVESVIILYIIVRQKSRTLCWSDYAMFL